MKTVSATEAKQHFAEMIDTAQREPVRIRRHNRDLAVVMSAEEYDRFEKARSKDRWAKFDRASAIATAQAKASGLTEEMLREILAER